MREPLEVGAPERRLGQVGQRRQPARPVAEARELPALYALLAGYYQQDTLARMGRAPRDD